MLQRNGSWLLGESVADWRKCGGLAEVWQVARRKSGVETSPEKCTKMEDFCSKNSAKILDLPRF